MATAALRGDARLIYTVPPASAVTHLLALPLLDVELGRREIVATIRAENQPAGLMDLLDAGLRDYTLTYRKTASGTQVPLKLVEVAGALLREGYHAWWSADGLSRTVVVVGAAPVASRLLSPDRERYGFGEWECRVRLRRVDGSNIDPATI